MIEPLLTEQQKALRDEVREFVKSVPRQLLLDIATEAKGTFTDIPSGRPFEFDIDPQPMVVDFGLVLAVASSRSATGPST